MDNLHQQNEARVCRCPSPAPRELPKSQLRHYEKRSSVSSVCRCVLEDITRSLGAESHFEYGVWQPHMHLRGNKSVVLPGSDVSAAAEVKLLHAATQSISLLKTCLDTLEAQGIVVTSSTVRYLPEPSVSNMG
ncbi:hypothetical protein PAAG_02041 [Paracoccidioides lutzii Pb01]|uniref:Uncharacterized protein n=1 Tax=Paracoccidioides lutzii (strain ATCC MYA-826 / Pb01) TaxID=502779 RepID=C1GU46_PARBA|nr:hypothetical protein PAAG_02041 [Paracoccidioides lutzii Pb01]EEH39852.2 hypothetical protein PAAG_02041 [Paracoccidioides lutzii Pb01]